MRASLSTREIRTVATWRGTTKRDATIELQLEPAGHLGPVGDSVTIYINTGDGEHAATVLRGLIEASIRALAWVEEGSTPDGNQ